MGMGGSQHGATQWDGSDDTAFFTSDHEFDYPSYQLDQDLQGIDSSPESNFINDGIWGARDDDDMALMLEPLARFNDEH